METEPVEEEGKRRRAKKLAKVEVALATSGAGDRTSTAARELALQHTSKCMLRAASISLARPSIRRHYCHHYSNHKMEASTRAAPAGYKVHRESTTEILVKSESKEVFINPIQEFNRDLSVLALGAWSSIFAQEKQKILDKKRAGRQERASKKRKLDEIDETAGVSTTRGQNGKARVSRA